MEYSFRERKIWIEFAIDVVVALYYFTAVFVLSGWNEITGKEIGEVIGNSITFAISATIILHLIFTRNEKEYQKDERDYSIDAKANAYGYYALVTFCLIIIGHIMINEGAEYFFSWSTEELSNPFIMHLIALSLLISSFVKSITQIVCYRRGYA